MSFNERFGDIRHRLLDRPTPMTFARVCRSLLEMWKEAPARVNVDVVPYVAESMATWPDEVLRYPGFMDPYWLEPTEHALGPLALMRELDLSYRYLGAGLVDALGRQPQMDGLRLLDLRSNALDEGALLELADMAHLTGLRTLRLGGNAVDGSGEVAGAIRSSFGEAASFGERDQVR